MLDSIKAVISDMDGVLWRGNEPLAGLVEMFDFFRENDLPFILATNNSRKTQSDYVHKLAHLGVDGIQPPHIITSGTATADYLQSNYPTGTRLYVVGGDGLKQIMVQAGFELIEEGQAEVVVVGIDFDMTYNRMRNAALQIRAGAKFVGTNPDASFPSPSGLVPGAGSLLALLQTATDVQPLVIGKPESAMFESALRMLGTQPHETLMLGDRIGTDISGAQAVGIRTALVLTGVETQETLAASTIQPDMVFDGLPELLSAWKRIQV